MKKIIAGSIGALVMSAGLVASAGTAAHAEPYPGTLPTNTTVAAPKAVSRKSKVNICATVAIASGTGTPTGTVTISVTRNSGKFKQAQSFAYAGGQVCLTTKKLKKVGGYNVKAAYVSTKGSIYSDSTGAGGFDVIKKKK